MNFPKLFTYFDKEYFSLEQETLFKKSPQYFGHKLMCPMPNDYHSIEWLNHAKLLYNKNNQLQLIDNICKHRQAIMLKGKGNSHNIVCDLHRWTYNPVNGQLIGAPMFDQLPACKNLEIDPLQEWKGLLFKSDRDINQDLVNIGQYANHINFENFQYSNTIITDYDFNWKTFIEVYAEDYHVDPFHPGLGNFVDCKGLKWQFGDWYHFQVVPTKNALNKPGSKLYQDWHKKVLEAHVGVNPDFGAVWMTLYPNIMIECYPKTIVISVAVPTAPEKCRVITEFYYPDEILGFDEEYVELQQQVYMETAKEDDEICYRMHEGRRTLYNAGNESYGPYQLPTEEGLMHFHKFLVRETKLS